MQIFKKMYNLYKGAAGEMERGWGEKETKKEKNSSAFLLSK